MFTQYAVHVIDPGTSRGQPPYLVNSSAASRVVVLRRNRAAGVLPLALALGWLLVLLSLAATAGGGRAQGGLLAFMAPAAGFLVLPWAFVGMWRLVTYLSSGLGCPWRLAQDVDVEEAARAVQGVPETEGDDSWTGLKVRIVPKDAARALAEMEAAVASDEKESLKREGEVAENLNRATARRAAEQRAAAIENAAARKTV